MIWAHNAQKRSKTIHTLVMSTPYHTSNPTGTMKTTLAALTALAIIAGLTLTGCTAPTTNQLPEEDSQQEPPLTGNEIDSARDPELGEIVEDITNPVTGARAYEEMQKVEGDDDLNSRVIVEYKGKKTEMQPISKIIEFSPNGKYLLYVHRSAPENENGTYLYNIETGKTQELVPSVPYSNPLFKPYPEDLKWEGNSITYEKSGTWTLTFEEE